MRITLLVTLASAAILAAGTTNITVTAALAQKPPPATGALPKELKSLRTGVVRVDTQTVDGAPTARTLGVRRHGTGVVIGERLVLTIGYLLLEAQSVLVTTGAGKEIPGTAAGYDHATGFGLVRTVLPLDGKQIEFGDSGALVAHQKVFTIGQGEAQATELMVVSRKPFVGAWEYMLERAIFTFPPVNNWSGAALLGADGKLLGIGSLIVADAATEPRGIPGNMFIPVDLLVPILKDLAERGRRRGPVQPWLGIRTEVVRGHVIVVRVSKKGPGALAGVEPGDIVVAVNGEKVASQADFYRQVWKRGPAGTEIDLKLLSGSETRELKVRSVDRIDTLARPSST